MENINKCKVTRRNRKGVLTRSLNELAELLSEENIDSEAVKQTLCKAETQFNNIEEAHCQVVDLIEKDEEFEEEEKWMMECQKGFTSAKKEAKKALLAFEDAAQGKEEEKKEEPSKPKETKGKGNDEEPKENEIPDDEHKDQVANLSTLVASLSLPRDSLRKFDGNSLYYHAFVTGFTNMTAGVKKDSLKLNTLMTQCTGDALEAIQFCVLKAPEEGFKIAMRTLKERYGNAANVAQAWIKKVTSRSKVDSNSIERFADDLENCYQALKSLHYLSEMNNQASLKQIVEKLPRFLQNRWVRENYRIHTETERNATLEDVLKFVKKSARELTDPVFGSRAWGADGSTTTSPGWARSNKREDSRTFHTQGPGQTGGNEKDCVGCNERQTHRLWECEGFKRQSVDSRWELAARHKLCFKCLGGHMARECKRKMRCQIDGCMSDHNRLLHKAKRGENGHQFLREGENQGRPTAGSSGSRASEAGTTNNYLNRKGTMALRCLPVRVKNGTKCIVVNALLDDGSDQTYINSGLAAELGIMGEQKEVVANVLNGKEERFQAAAVEVEIAGLESVKTHRLQALTVDNVCGALKPTDWSMISKDWEHLRDVTFPYPTKGVVEMLIGIDYAELHVALEERVGRAGEPIARKTPLGWTCVGPTTKTNRCSTSAYHARQVNTFKCCSEDVKHVDRLLQKFWDVENVGNVKARPSQTDEEIRAVEKVNRSMKKVEGGRYEVELPWKESKESLPKENMRVAKNRFANLEKKLNKDANLKEAYTKVIGSYRDKGYISKVDPADCVYQQWFLPHFPVVRPERDTTKVRVVFDAAASCGGTSLNDVIANGPKLQNDLFDVLLRFRRRPVALMCDISEMYLQIGIAQEDRAMFRFLWRDMYEANAEPEIYEFNRLAFGVNAAPFISQVVAQENARAHRDKYPLAAEAVLKSTYMDDTMESVGDVRTAIQLYKELRELWGKAGMHARKWLSNSKDVMQAIPQDQRAKEVNLTESDLPSVSTLGLTWCTEGDQFGFKDPEFSKTNYGQLTKRKVLSKISSVFDPMGFVSPVVIKGKIIMQEIWQNGSEWDEPLAGELQDKVHSWVDDLVHLKDVNVTRCLFSEGEESTALHTFVDASSEAYGAVTYVRSVRQGNVSVRLVASKTRVAPLKSVSIPRLELMAAMLGLRLTQSITEVLEYNMENVMFWSDSTNVLWWIRGRSRSFKPFVANRVGEIQSVTSPSQWRYVPTKVNPADLASRGTTTEKLSGDQLWWHGPEYLMKPPSEWPENKVAAEANPEERKRVVSYLTTRNPCPKPGDGWRLDPSRYESWTKLQRVTAYVMRFVNNCSPDEVGRVHGALSTDEIQQAEVYLIKQAQQESFEEDLKHLTKKGTVEPNSQLSALLPQLDDDGLIRMTGRLSLVETLPHDVRYPIILPRKHAITRLIVRQYHEIGNHSLGTNHLLSSVLEKYWIVHGREEIREYERGCVQCKRRSAKTASQIMAPLPEHRASVSLRAFTKIAVDYAGPFYTMQGRGRVRTKRYLCLFTCLATRAVHLEIAYGLDTDTFLNAFQRFVSRRGKPEEVYSDNGSNFIGADNELKAIVKLLDQTRVQEATTSQGIKWSFIPPATPHFGGVHESLIKSAKRAIYAVLRNADITDEELHSAFVGAEGIMNSRPLTYVSASGKDPTPLTPNHFLHGSMGGNVAPEEVLDSTRFNPRRRWRRVQELMKHFWGRWLREWLPQLNRRSKWRETKRDLAVNDVVIVAEKDIPRGKWPLGRVVEVYPGSDGHVRVVKVRTGKGDMTRGITKVCPLEVMESDM